MSTTPRLRMFAGPNGSGKSTLKAVLPSTLLGIYINPDEIEYTLRRDRRFASKDYGVAAGPRAITDFLERSQLLKRATVRPQLVVKQPEDGSIIFENDAINPYLASVLADFLRQELISACVSFTFETVMSSPDKIGLLTSAKTAGYRNYLYYVATEDPVINIARVRNRVLRGGHPVPEDKIATRYYRSLELLKDAIKQTDRAYMFDNSGDGSKPTWFAEITNGEQLESKTDQMPAWFKRAVLDKNLTR